MTRSGDSAATKRSILEAARACFAEAGFAGTSTRTIAARAKVAQPLIHRYFGTKQDLFSAVLERSLLEYSDEQKPRWDLSPEDPRFYVEGIAVLFDWYGTQRDLLRLGAWARLEGYPLSSMTFKGYWDRLRARVEDGRRLGIVRQDADPEALLLTVDAMVKGYWDRAGSAGWLGWDSEDLDARVRWTVVSLFARGVLEPEHAERALEAFRPT